jgi:hypothetical protein
MFELLKENKLISFYFDYVIISVIYLNKDIFTKLFILIIFKLSKLNYNKNKSKIQNNYKKLKSNFNQIYKLTRGII